jgi:hypothetical protein
MKHYHIHVHRASDAMHYGTMTGGMAEQRDESFGKLSGSLAHRKGVHNPKALAAWIGRKDLGEKEMARRSAEGRK